MINEEKLGDFFMMDGEDEAREFGAAGNYERAAELGKEMFKTHTVSKFIIVNTYL